MTRVLWFTGLSGSGKSTIAEALKAELEKQSQSVEMLDGDVVRNTLHKNLGFSREDIRENNRLIAELAKKSKADVVLVPIISPYREDRTMARNIIGQSFKELYIQASLQACIQRDVKGLYKKALAGEINNFIGIAPSNPYQPPLQPEIVIDTENQEIQKSVKAVMDYLVRNT